jgi:hypothetical protein
MAADPRTPALHTEGLTKRFRDVLALARLDVTVEQGKVCSSGPTAPGTRRRSGCCCLRCGSSTTCVSPVRR